MISFALTPGYLLAIPESVSPERITYSVGADPPERAEPDAEDLLPEAGALV